MEATQPRLGLDEAEIRDPFALPRAAGWTKRAFDVVVAAVSLVLLTPLLLVIALAVKLDDGGPALFLQPRVGRGGRRFRIVKFRTMVVGAEAHLRADPALYDRYVRNSCKLDLADDPRVSRLGRFLRASSLDEIPQLLNVLQGDMSLVGPRPIVEVELRQYQDRGAVAAYLNARPGVTGLWQVSGRNRLGYQERVQLDLVYLSSPSLANDVRILLRTPMAVFRRDGVH